jgi:hypothetical protein
MGYRSPTSDATGLTVEMQEAGVKRRNWATKRKVIILSVVSQ